MKEINDLLDNIKTSEEFFLKLLNNKVSIYLSSRVEIKGFLVKIFKNGFLVTTKNAKSVNEFSFKDLIFINIQTISSISLDN